MEQIRLLVGMLLGPDERMKRTEKIDSASTYTSGPLEQDIELYGHPIVTFGCPQRLIMETSLLSGDVDERGEAIMLRGKLRAGLLHRGLFPR